MLDLEHDGLNVIIAVAGEGRDEDLHFTTNSQNEVAGRLVLSRCCIGAWRQDVYGRESVCYFVRMWTAINSET